MTHKNSKHERLEKSSYTLKQIAKLATSIASIAVAIREIAGL